VAGNLWVPQYGGVIITGGGSGLYKDANRDLHRRWLLGRAQRYGHVDQRVVTAITMNYGSTGGGFGCTSAPTVSFTAAPTGGTTATAYAVVVPPLAPAPLVSGYLTAICPMSFWTRNDTHDPTLFLHEGDCQIDSDGSIDNYDTEGATQTLRPKWPASRRDNQANGGRQGMPNYYYNSLAAAQNTAGATRPTSPPPLALSRTSRSGSNLICATLACAEGVLILHCRTRRGWTPVRVTIWLPDWLAERSQSGKSVEHSYLQQL